MKIDRLGSRLGHILLVALSPGCGGTVDGPAQKPDEADSASMTDGGAIAYDAASEAWVADASPDVVIDAGAPDASCVVVDPGTAGGANCRPMILSCNPPVSGPLNCAVLCVGHPESGCFAFDSGATVNCYYGCGGRRPLGFEATPRDALRSVGAFFANLAELEAASIDAFAILRDELVAHGAPCELVSAAEGAARDEVRHAKITRALALRHGGRPEPRRLARHPVRDREAMAVENAREGCVRETFGALIAMHQAERAIDPIIRRAMKRIARDETRHAALSWQVHAWLSSTLSDDARARVDNAMREALADLSTEVSREPAEEVVAIAGIPSRQTSTRLLAGFRNELLAES